MTPRTRRAILVLAGPAMLGAVLVHGRAVDAAGLSFAECVEQPQDCDAASVYVGYGRVRAVEGDAVVLEKATVVAYAAPFPVPVPEVGGIASVLGRFEPPNRIVPSAARLHPHRRLKEWTGYVGAVGWAAAVLALVRDGRGRRRA